MSAGAELTESADESRRKLIKSKVSRQSGTVPKVSRQSGTVPKARKFCTSFCLSQ